MESIAAAVRRFFNSPGFKFFLIGGLILVLTIPMILVWVLVSEREQRASSVRMEVAREWGGAQTINGPVLIVPYTVLRVTGQGENRVEELIERRAVFLPETLNVKGKATTKVLHRAIYDVAVYTGILDFEGRFDAPDMSAVAPDAKSVRWRDAVLAVAHQRRVRPQDGGVGDHRRRSEASFRAEPRRARGTRRRHSRPPCRRVEPVR